MRQSQENVRLLQRKCGGWLAVSHRWNEIRIGVTAESEAEARDKFIAALAEWRAMLAGAHDGVTAQA